MHKTKIFFAATTIIMMSRIGVAEAVNISMPQVSKSIAGSVIGDKVTGELNIQNGVRVVGHAAVATAVDAASVPAAVSIASASGMTASTGTAISTLSGAAATSATLAGVGTSVLELVGLAGTVAIAPAVVGGVVVVGVGASVAFVINNIFF